MAIRVVVGETVTEACPLGEDGKVPTENLPSGGSGDMTKATYDPNADGVIATAQLDMTAITTAILLAAHPVGSIYESVISTEPGTLFGGTWAALGAGRILVGIDAGDPNFDVAEETGGAKTVASSAQSFAGSQLAAHQHAAITAGTPAGTVAAIGATATTAVKIGTAGATGAAQTHTHAAPAFTGSALATPSSCARAKRFPSTVSFAKGGRRWTSQ